MVTVLINVGMWFERYVIIVTSLSHEFVTVSWAQYVPSAVEMKIMVGSFGWFFMWFLLFIKVLPVISIAEVKERYLHQLPKLQKMKEANNG